MNMIQKDVTKLEDLSNEIFIELFEYLIAEDLFLAFSNLQLRINQLLKDSNVLMHIAVRKISYIQSLYNSNRIRFITVKSLNTSTFAADISTCSVMPNATQLFLDNFYVPDLILGLSDLKFRMANLVHISIEGYTQSSSSASNNVNFIIDRLFPLSHLRTLNLKIDFHTKHYTYIRLSNIKQIPSLEYFSLIGCNLSIISVIDLMINAPRLKFLQLRIELYREHPDYSVFKQLIRGTFEFIHFDDLNLEKILSSMNDRVHLRLDNDTLASIKRLGITHPKQLTQIPMRYFNPW